MPSIESEQKELLFDHAVSESKEKGGLKIILKIIVCELGTLNSKS
jgi:hypothetical protein